MKKLLLLSTVFILAGCAYTGDTAIKSEKAATVSIDFDENYREGSPPFSNTVVCKLKLTATASKHSTEQRMEASSTVEPNFNSFTITEIDSENPILVGSDGYRTDLMKVDFAGDRNTVYMFEVTGAGYLNVWTLFREANILSLTKQYDLFGPFAMAEIGDCKSGLN